MNAADKPILESTQQICYLYHNHVDVKEAVELMQSQGISANMANAIYDQLSLNAEKLMKDRFHNYTIEFDICFDNVAYWTSRYLFAYGFESTDPALHEIIIVDSFNDKSM
jgi:hypothetical protein